MLALVRRVRLLPEGGNPDPLKDTGLARYLATVLKHAQTAGQVKLDPAARELWWHTYPQLTEPGEHLASAISARAEAHTIRLALLYALLDGQRHISPRTYKRRSRSGTTPPAQPHGHSARQPATRSPNNSTPRSPATPTG